MSSFLFRFRIEYTVLTQNPFTIMITLESNIFGYESVRCFIAVSLYTVHRKCSSETFEFKRPRYDRHTFIILFSRTSRCEFVAWIAASFHRSFHWTCTWQDIFFHCFRATVFFWGTGTRIIKGKLTRILELHRFGYDMQTEQNNWFRDIIWYCMSVTMYWRSSHSAPCYRKFDKLEEKRIVVTSLAVQSTCSITSCLLSSRLLNSRCGLTRVLQHHEWSWMIPSGNDDVRTQHESWERNADKELKFFFCERANVMKHAYECLNDFLSLSILSERYWRYWRTYVSISFLNFCWDVADFWWVFRIQGRCCENLADVVHFCRLSESDIMTLRRDPLTKKDRHEFVRGTNWDFRTRHMMSTWRTSVDMKKWKSRWICCCKIDEKKRRSQQPIREITESKTNEIHGSRRRVWSSVIGKDKHVVQAPIYFRDRMLKVGDST